MNYQHLYHAGNFADVMKHCTLLLLLEKLRTKESAFAVLDTHAGNGLYDLESEKAKKTEEAGAGVLKLLDADIQSTILKTYLALVKNYLPYYPGSPLIVKSQLRTQDRLVLSELHEGAFTELKRIMKHAQIELHHMNAYHALKAFLPPKEKRGLVLIDPPFEKTSEFDDLVKGMEQARERFAHGIYMIWYPIKARPPVELFHQKMREVGFEKTLIAELLIYPDDTPARLNGSGLYIVNPPWQIEAAIELLFQEILRLLGREGTGRVRISS